MLLGIHAGGIQAAVARQDVVEHLCYNIGRSEPEGFEKLPGFGGFRHGTADDVECRTGGTWEICGRESTRIEWSYVRAILKADYRFQPGNARLVPLVPRHSGQSRILLKKCVEGDDPRI